MEKQKFSFKLTKEASSKEFILQKPGSVIIIRKAYITNLLDKNNWFIRIKDLGLYFEFSSSNYNDPHLIHPRVDFLINLGANYQNPIFEFNLIVPIMNRQGVESADFCKDVKIDLKSTGNLSDFDEISVFGEFTEGVGERR